MGRSHPAKGFRNSTLRRPRRHPRLDQLLALVKVTRRITVSTASRFTQGKFPRAGGRIRVAFSLTRTPNSVILKSLRGVASADLCGYSSGSGLPRNQRPLTEHAHLCDSAVWN